MSQHVDIIYSFNFEYHIVHIVYLVGEEWPYVDLNNGGFANCVFYN